MPPADGGPWPYHGKILLHLRSFVVLTFKSIYMVHVWLEH